ncbi:tetratricopeptide repeat protein [Parvibaculaceae bacterium PLY_AMNH_Bact1]|nr:tetratricopeptide repeat protein [Parvibaculaceae bacterium PLY_AMNH_Bact1]
MPSNTQIGHGNIAVQIVGDGNTVVADHPHLLLTRYEADRLSADDIAKREPTQLLAARQRTIPTIGRGPLLDEYEVWLNSDAAISVRVLVGSAGRGKTRFGLDLCDRAVETSWQAGFATSAEIRRFRAQQNLAGWGWSKPVLLVVDYASSVSQELHDWLAELAQNQGLAGSDNDTPPLRILLLDRTADATGGWLQTVYGRGGGDRDSIDRLLDRPEPYALPPIEDMEDRRQLLIQMLAAQGSDLLPPAAGEDAWFDQRLAELSWGGEPLFLMMAASLAAQESFASVLALARDDMALRIADDELARIDRTLSSTDEPRAFVHHMVAIVTLCGGLDQASALDMIMDEEKALRHRLPSGPAGCLDVLRQVLPMIEGRLAPIEPDMIGEAVMLRVWESLDDEEMSQLINRAAAQEACRSVVIGSVIRTCQDYALHGHTTPLYWLDALSNAAALDLEELLELVDALPSATLELRERALSLTERALTAIRQLPVEGAEAHPTQLLLLLNALSLRLTALGRHEEALTAIEEAVVILRAKSTPLNTDHAVSGDILADAFAAHRTEGRHRKADFALLLFTLSNAQATVGQHTAALVSIEEVVELSRELVRKGHTTINSELAASLNGLSILQNIAGRSEDALASAVEAEAIYRGLAAERPDVFRPNLAVVLDNLAHCLSTVSRLSEALAACEEAVSIRRNLAAAHPDAYLPDLACSLINLPNRLNALHKHSEALSICKEAVALHRTLSNDRPDAFLPNLGKSLNNLANSFWYLKRIEEAAAADEEAIAVYRKLVDKSPEVFSPDLIRSLKNLAAKWKNTDRWEDGYALFKEAQRVEWDYVEALNSRRDSIAKSERDAMPEAEQDMPQARQHFRNWSKVVWSFSLRSLRSVLRLRNPEEDD